MHHRTCLAIGLALFAMHSPILAHGLIEKPASREQFCGVETKPHDIYTKLAHEECRPILTKADGTLENGLYNFMAVLTHTTGRQGRTANNLPKNVCGFDAEPWGGGKTPWDTAMKWPVSTLSPGKNQFVWNISWGNHFGDTEEFAYWITKPGFVFDSSKPLAWSDFEDTPFCLLKYDDTQPNANSAIVPDKANNKFTTTCTVPTRQGRAVIYAEWGRNRNTFERFHSCLDVVFSGSTPTPSLKAVISTIPDTVTGASELTLDGSQSQGSSLAYQWTVSADNTSYYTLYDATLPKARLVLKNPAATQRVSINLSVRQGSNTDNTSTAFSHMRLTTSPQWKLVGTPLVNDTLKAGDGVSLRIIDRDGMDRYLPATPLTLDATSATPANWSYTLAQAVNGKNVYSVMIGVLNASTGVITPARSATSNQVYVPTDSAINNAYVNVTRSTTPSSNCRAQKKSGGSAWWMGYDVFSANEPILLDFTGTGIDLSQLIIDAGVFSDVKVLSSSKLLINHKPGWVSQTSAGYIGFRANNYTPLTTSLVAACQAG